MPSVAPNILRLIQRGVIPSRITILPNVARRPTSVIGGLKRKRVDIAPQIGVLLWRGG